MIRELIFLKVHQSGSIINIFQRLFDMSRVQSILYYVESLSLSLSLDIESNACYTF